MSRQPPKVNRIVLALALLSPTLANASDWRPLPGGYEKDFSIDVSSVQSGTMEGSHTPTLGIWVKSEDAPLFQVWVDCKGRGSSTYTVGSSSAGVWTPWAPIPPDTMEWAVWEYLCQKPKDAKAPR